MLEISDASPDVKRDMRLRNQINRKLYDGVSHLLSVCEKSGIPTNKEQSILDSFDYESKISGMLHVVNNRLLDAVRRKSLGEVSVVLSALRKYKYVSQDTRLICWHDGNYHESLSELYYDACDDGFRNTYGVHFDGGALNKADKEKSIDNACIALNKVKRVIPDIYNELNVLVSDLMLIYSPTMNAASSVSSLGIIRMSQIREGQSWTRYFENIVHEEAHQHLNYIFHLDPIILNEGQNLYDSPLRKEKRPLSGIYHALFVLARTVRALSDLKESNEFDPERDVIETAYNNKGNSASFEEKFQDCWDLIGNHAKLTDVGKKLMISAREYAFD